MQTQAKRQTFVLDRVVVAGQAVREANRRLSHRLVGCIVVVVAVAVVVDLQGLSVIAAGNRERDRDNYTTSGHYGIHQHKPRILNIIEATVWPR